ncbi:MAG: LamG-like jellyroll fold domain-containing protein, partial [Verrucomicrobiaceae bacterium]
VWQNPQNGVEWVYVRNGPNKKGLPESGSSVDRYQISQPLIEEPVWRNKKLPLEDFQLSSDGQRSVGTFPWPTIGYANLSTGEFTKLATGCWPSMSPDDSYRCWAFEGSHRAIKMFAPDQSNSWTVPINETPETNGREVYHPRWTNHPRFLCMTGPYRKIGAGGKNVSVYLGKFDSEYHKIEKWVKVTHNAFGDFFPNVWIDPAASATAVATGQPSTKEKRASNPSPGILPKSASSPPDPGLIFTWENGVKQGLLIDPQTNTAKSVTLQPRGLVFFDRDYEMNLVNSVGSYLAKEADDALLAGPIRSNQLSIEAVIVPGRKNQPGPAQIITFSSTPESRNFSLAQEDDTLTFRIRTSLTKSNEDNPVFNLCQLTPSVPNHVLITFQIGHVTCHLNGKKVFDEDCPKGDLSNWARQHLVFGDEWEESKADWSGKLEGVAIYSLALDAGDAARKWACFQEKLKGRKPVEQIVVKARLRGVTRPPTPESIAPYTRALIVNDFEVEEVLSGKLTDKNIQTAHWGVLNSVYAMNKWGVGCIYVLNLEKFSDQPQLEGERVVSDSNNFGLPLYYTTAVKRLINRHHVSEN